MDPQSIVALITALGLGSIVPSMVSGVTAHFTGRAEAERQRNADALTIRDAAWARAEAVERRAEERITAVEAERDAAEAAERCSREYAAMLRRCLLESGWRYADLPPYPGSTTTASPLIGDSEV